MRLWIRFFLEKGLSWRQASDQCRSMGARLPEIKSAQENSDVLSVKVCTRIQIFTLLEVFLFTVKFSILTPM
jgi:hypothetical protein